MLEYHEKFKIKCALINKTGNILFVSILKLAIKLDKKNPD